MKTKFNSLASQFLTESDNTFSTKVKVIVHINSTTNAEYEETESSITALVVYNIDIDYKTWGINDIRVTLIKIPYFNITFREISEKSELKNLTINIDVSKLQQNIVRSNIIKAGDLELYIDENGIINYSDSKITIYSL